MFFTMEQSKLDKKREFLTNTLYIGMIILLIYLTAKYFIPWLMPFIIGFAIAMMFKPVISFLDRKTRLNRKLIALIVTLLGYVFVGFVVFLIGSQLVEALVTTFKGLPDFYNDSLSPAISNLSEFVTDLFERFGAKTSTGGQGLLNTLLESLQKWIAGLSEKGLSGLTGFVGNLPRLIIGFIFTIMSSIIISMDYDGIASFVMKQIPKKPRHVLFEAKGVLSGTIFKYIKAYFILMLITFVELTIGFSIIRVENAATVAILISLFDMLPVFGTGGVIIPWILIELIKGNYSLVIGLTVVYIIITVVRNIIEPKIVGDQLGLSPLVTLVAIYLGFIWMGVAGMILLPITIQIIISLHNSGSIKLWN